jgi:hypothetical protein
MDTITIILEVSAAQEIASTIRSTVRKIDLVLDKNPPTRNGEAEKLDNRAKLLTQTAALIEATLHQRALNNGKSKESSAA